MENSLNSTINLTKHKIGILICWYGKFPWYFNFFVHSAKFNPSIDFIIVTDENITIQLPENIKIIKKSFEDTIRLIETKLGCPVTITSAYKLCDFKPAYGLIFEDYLEKYNFWGHGDIDVIFGNIRNFITEHILSENDFISVRRDYITGYFVLFRNTKKMNLLFTESKDYKIVFANNQNYCFDECNHLHQFIVFNRNNILEINADIESMEHVVKKNVVEGKIKAHFDFLVVEGNPGNLKWENGKLFYKEKYEMLLYHLIVFKNLKNKSIPKWKIMPSSFHISKFSICSTEKKLSPSFLKEKYLEVIRLKSKIILLFRENFLGKLIASRHMKKILPFKKINSYEGMYKNGLHSNSYIVSQKNKQLNLQENNYCNVPLYHLWLNKFITPDFKTTMKFIRKNGQRQIISYPINFPQRILIKR